MSTLFVNVGTHRTDFVSAFEGEPATMFSIPIGATQLTFSELSSDPPRAEELSNAIAMAHAHMDDLLREMPAVKQCTRAVGTGPTVFTMALVELGSDVPEAIDGFILSRPAAEDVYRTLATESLDDRVYNPGLARAEAADIVGGCCIVVAIMRRLSLPELQVSPVARLPLAVSSLLGGTR